MRLFLTKPAVKLLSAELFARLLMWSLLVFQLLRVWLLIRFHAVFSFSCRCTHRACYQVRLTQLNHKCSCGWLSYRGCKVVDLQFYREGGRKKNCLFPINGLWNCHSIEIYYFYYILVFAASVYCSRGAWLGFSCMEISGWGGGRDRLLCIPHNMGTGAVLCWVLENRVSVLYRCTLHTTFSFPMNSSLCWCISVKMLWLEECQRHSRIFS